MKNIGYNILYNIDIKGKIHLIFNF